jgi:hypothetical protein
MVLYIIVGNVAHLLSVQMQVLLQTSQTSLSDIDPVEKALEEGLGSVKTEKLEERRTDEV